jgi:hypothetical protein
MTQLFLGLVVGVLIGAALVFYINAEKEQQEDERE